MNVFQQTRKSQSCGFYQNDQVNEVPHVYFMIDHKSEKPK